jgi:hypothetical protein
MCRKTYRKDKNINPQDKVSLHKKTKIQEKSRLPHTKLTRPALLFLRVFTPCVFISQSAYSYLYARTLDRQALFRTYLCLIVAFLQLYLWSESYINMMSD